MDKKDKIEYINDVHKRFDEAKNHEASPYRLSYKVKMHNWGNVEALRAKLSALQNDFYDDDDDLEHAIYREREDQCEMLHEDITGQTGLLDLPLIESASFAGRSGGWFEIQYSHCLDYVDDDTDDEDVEAYYKSAKELTRQEREACAFIERAHTAYDSYVDSDDYYRHLRDTLRDDDEIRQEYRERAMDLLAKANK